MKVFMKCLPAPVALLVVALCVPASTGRAAPIAIVNADFEADGQVINVPTPSTPATAPTGWYAIGGAGDLYDLQNGAGKAGSVALRARRDSHRVWQTLTHGWQPTDLFELTFWAKDWDNKDPDVVVQLFESDADDSSLGDNPLLWTGSVLNAPNGGADFLLNIDASTFTTGTPGNNIVLWFGSPAGTLDYYDLDDVALSVESQAVPEPASIAVWSILGFALASFGYLRLRRQV